MFFLLLSNFVRLFLLQITLHKVISLICNKILVSWIRILIRIKKSWIRIRKIECGSTAQPFPHPSLSLGQALRK